MDQRKELEALLLDRLGWIEKVVSSLCRRNGIFGDDVDDFASWVKMKLVEDDYAVFRKFRGESAITTYLTVVISMLFREYRVTRWGRWRPSVAARRHGPAAVRLEMLVNRDGYTLSQAVEILSTSGDGAPTAREAAGLLAEFPSRATAREFPTDPRKLISAESTLSADGPVEVEERDRERRAAEDALAEALDQMDPQDRLILKMKFWDGLTVAEIARATDLEQKPLYRRLERALSEMRRRLERAGVSREVVASLVEASDMPHAPETAPSRLSSIESGR